MTVTMTVADSLANALAFTDFNDALADGTAGTTNVGMDLGQVVNGKYAPLIDELANTGAKDVFLAHDATVDPVTDVKFFMDPFSGANGYGGPGSRSAATDRTTILDEGNTAANIGTPPDKNNANGLGGGIFLDMDWDVVAANQFDWGTNSGNAGNLQGNETVFIFGAFGGAGTGEGRDLTNSFTLQKEAMVYDAPGETAATTPVDGSIGKDNDTVLGEAAHIRARVYIRTAFVTGGIFQFDLVTAFSFTA